MEKSLDLLAFGPSDEARRFVIAAAAAGLPSEIICLMLPRIEGQAPLDPRQLDKAIARAGGPMLGVRLNVACVVNRGLTDGEGSDAAQMAVFKAAGDWGQLSQLAEEGARYDFGRLRRAERNTLRWLLKKADTTADRGDGSE